MYTSTLQTDEDGEADRELGLIRVYLEGQRYSP